MAPRIGDWKIATDESGFALIYQQPAHNASIWVVFVVSVTPSPIISIEVYPPFAVTMPVTNNTHAPRHDVPDTASQFRIHPRR